MKNITGREMAKSALLLAVALGTQERCREDIDKQYETDKIKYYLLAERAGVGKSNVFNRHSVTTSEYVKKIFSIILDEFSNDRKLFLTRLIKKAYKPAYTFYTHKSQIIFEVFVAHEEARLGGLERVSGVYLDYCFYVMYYLSLTEGDKIVKTPLYNIIDAHYSEMIVNNTLEDMVEDILKGNLDIISNEDIKPNYAGSKEFIEKVSHKGFMGDDVIMVFETIKLKEEDILIQKGYHAPSFSALLDKMPLTQITNAFYIMMRMFSLDFSILSETKFDDKFLKGLIRYLHVMKNANGLKDRDIEILYFSSLVMYALAKEYNNVRQIHYENARSQLIKKEIEEERIQSEMELSLTLQVGALTNEKEELKQDLDLVSKESSLKTKEINSLSLELKRTQKELEKAKENEKELQFLRKFYFDTVNNKVPEVHQDLTLDEIIEHLSSVEGVVIGGHPNLQRKLKELLPSFIFVEVDETNRNLSFLKNSDIIFFYSEHNNHTMYRRVMGEVKSSNVLLSYLDGNTNIEFVIREIFSKVQVLVKA